MPCLLSLLHPTWRSGILRFPMQTLVLPLTWVLNPYRNRKPDSVCTSSYPEREISHVHRGRSFDKLATAIAVGEVLYSKTVKVVPTPSPSRTTIKQRRVGAASVARGENQCQPLEALSHRRNPSYASYASPFEPLPQIGLSRHGTYLEYR